MDETRSDRKDSPAAIRWAGVGVLAVFWLVQFAELTVVALIKGRQFANDKLPERIVVVCAGMALGLVLVELAVRLEGRPFRVRLAGTLATAFAMCALLVLFALGLAHLGPWNPGPIDVAGFVLAGFAWSWFFLSVACVLLAISYNAETRRRERRLARLEIVARDARIAALRYQIDPHFLFNSLNAIAGLVQTDGAVAERMVENLSDFLRATLELDPVEDIPLAQEMALQRLYLSIERARFPHRLSTVFDVPPDLGAMPVPALVTQPLVENAIKHAVARSAGLVTLRVSARLIDRHLSVRVDDDGGTAAGPPRVGTGTGLQNVRERLSARFDGDYTLSTGPLEHGGFRSEIRLPMEHRS